MMIWDGWATLWTKLGVQAYSEPDQHYKIIELRTYSILEYLATGNFYSAATWEVRLFSHSVQSYCSVTAVYF
jgi:hypothetical protein